MAFGQSTTHRIKAVLHLQQLWVQHALYLLEGGCGASAPVNPQDNPPIAASLGGVYKQHFRKLSRLALPHQPSLATPVLQWLSVQHLSLTVHFQPCAKCIFKVLFFNEIKDTFVSSILHRGESMNCNEPHVLAT